MSSNVKSQKLITPIVSAVYNTADLSDRTTPSRHSTGLVWADMEPSPESGIGSNALDISLKYGSVVYECYIRIGLPESNCFV